MEIIGVLVALLFIAVIAKAVVRRRSKSDESDPIIGTEADLAAAEKALAEMPIDIRERLVETHELVARFNTQQGFSQEYVDDVTAALRAQGIGCEVVFQATMPMGLANSFLIQQGLFELYVEQEKVETAKAELKRLKTTHGT